jgi:predicted DNA-binding transcriptional regulator YafY
MSNQKKILRVLQFISYLEQKPSKSIQSIASVLETTERTAYRYLDLIRDCGFRVNKDKFNRYFIEGKLQDGVYFTSEEAEYLKSLVLTVGKRNKLKDSVLSKIYLCSDIKVASSQLVYAKNGQIVEQLSQAIVNEEQVILKKYHSINSESISDRLVEPFGFTDNYHSVMAFEIKSQKNKTFHLDRITSIDFINKHFQFKSSHVHQDLDAFGFSFNGEKYHVKKQLNLKGFLLLKDEYPLTIPNVKFNKQTEKYELDILVNSLEAVNRFFAGIN